jgi:ferredoxin-NADP reductase
MSTNLNVRVKQIQQLTPVIREFSFEAVDQDLPPFSSGRPCAAQCIFTFE